MVRLVVWVPEVWGILRSPLEYQVETTLGLFGTEHFLKETPLKPNGCKLKNTTSWPSKRVTSTQRKTRFLWLPAPSFFFVGVCKLIEAGNGRFSMDPKIHMLWDFQSCIHFLQRCTWYSKEPVFYGFVFNWMMMMMMMMMMMIPNLHIKETHLVSPKHPINQNIGMFGVPGLGSTIRTLWHGKIGSLKIDRYCLLVM